MFSIFQVWYEQIMCFLLRWPSGELIPSLELLILREGRWLLVRASCARPALDSAVSLSDSSSPAWGRLPVSMSWEAAHAGLERGAHKSQAECFLLPQFVLDFVFFES